MALFLYCLNMFCPLSGAYYFTEIFEDQVHFCRCCLQYMLRFKSGRPTYQLSISCSQLATGYTWSANAVFPTEKLARHTFLQVAERQALWDNRAQRPFCPDLDLLLALRPLPRSRHVWRDLLQKPYTCPSMALHRMPRDSIRNVHYSDFLLRGLTGPALGKHSCCR